MICPECSSEIQIGTWPFCGGDPMLHVQVMRRFNQPAVSEGERSVVYYHPQTGEVRYPGRADSPMPERYEDGGFIRREFDSLHALRQFEKEQGVSAEHTWTNSGNSLDLPEGPNLTERLESIKEKERQLYRDVGMSHLINPDGSIKSTPLDSKDIG